MKKLALTLTLTLACVAAFAQGKVRFVNDSLHLVYFTTDTSKLLSTDAALAGKATSIAAGANLTAELWGGTSAGSLAKISTTSFATGAGFDGTFNGVNVTTAFASGTPSYYQVQVYTTSATSYAAAAAGTGLYYGETAVFTTVPSGSIAYNSIANPTYSTWANGTQNLDNSPWGTGSLGSIALQANVTVVPEPASLALLGLGAAGLMIFRRRK